MNDGFDNARQYAAVVGDTVGGAVDNVRQEIANVGDLIHNTRQYLSGRIINPKGEDIQEYQDNQNHMYNHKATNPQ